MMGNTLIEKEGNGLVGNSHSGSVFGIGNSFLLLFFFLGFDILSPSSNIKTSALFYKNITTLWPGLAFAMMVFICSGVSVDISPGFSFFVVFRLRHKQEKRESEIRKD